MKLTKFADHIFEVETYQSLDYPMAEQELAKKLDWTAGCTCFVRVTPDGQTITGRNYDLTISNKPVYILRTACEGCYKTVGLEYDYSTGPDYDEVQKTGISDYFAKMIPFLSSDIMNEKGLYIETNMRNGETVADGTNSYICSGTNPSAPHRIVAYALPRYVAEHCATVEEAIEYIRNELDLYTPKTGFPWNFCFMLADCSGNYGLLEIAKNQISWLPGQAGQCNFYITEAFRETELLPCGLGRYETVMKDLHQVNEEEDMLRLMKKATYFQVYQDHPAFDVRSEYVGFKPHWTIDYVLAEEHQDEIMEQIRKDRQIIGAMSRQELQDSSKYWESIYTVIGNCHKRTLMVRFFEDDARIASFHVD